MATTKNLHLMMTADAKSVEATLGRMDKMMSGLKAQTAGLRQATAAVIGGANPFDMIKGGVKGLVESIPGVGPALSTAFNLAEGFFNKIRAVQKDIGSIGKEAAAAGAGIKGYSALKYMASDAEAMGAALFKLGNASTDAALKGGELDAVYKQLGLDAMQMAAMTSDEQFLKLAGALEKVSRPMKNYFAREIFGKGAYSVMAELLKGEDKLRKGMDIAQQHGSVITEEDLAAVKAANKAMKEFDATIDSTWKTLSVQFAPLIKSVATDLRQFEVGIKNADSASHDLGTRTHQLMNELGSYDHFLQGVYHILTGDKGKARAHLLDAARDGGERALEARAEFNRMIQETLKQHEKEQQALEGIRKMQQEAAAAERERVAMEQKAQAERQRMIEGSISERQKFMEQLEETANFDIGHINGRFRLLAKLYQDADKFERDKASKLESPGILERGTREAASAITKFETQSDRASRDRAKDPDLQRLIEQMRDRDRELIRIGKKIQDQFEKLGLAER